MVEHVVADAGAFLKNAALHVSFHEIWIIIRKQFVISVFILSYFRVYSIAVGINLWCSGISLASCCDEGNVNKRRVFVRY